MERERFQGLNYLIQYRRKDEVFWHNMAAFDALGAAERYFAKQGGVAGDIDATIRRLSAGP